MSADMIELLTQEEELLVGSFVCLVYGRVSRLMTIHDVMCLYI